MSAKFTTGSTMRHVIVMTSTASIGLMALFFVDAMNLFYISMLGVTELAAAIGFAGTLQFFMISIAIGLLIAGTATVSRAIGAGHEDRARQYATSAMLTSGLTMAILAGAMWIYREDALSLLGAEGEALRQASHFLSIALPSLPLIGIGMICSGTLRAHGEASQAMWVTLGGGSIAAVLDPIFIFGLDLGVTGAAISIAVTRLGIAGIGLWLVIGRHNMMARPSLPAWLADLPRLANIAGPTMATQLATPFGMAYLTNTVAVHGDDAVAGWAVIGRVAALAFGCLFALAGAVGPIIGQNYGAKLYPRIAAAYRDALICASIYVIAAWGVLLLFVETLVEAFGLSAGGAEVFRAFAHWGAPAYLFTGALFVSNAAYNNLGRPLWSTGFNWSRDGLVIPALAALTATALGITAAVTIQAIAGVIVGTAAAITGWRLVTRIADTPKEPLPEIAPVVVSGRAAETAVPEPLVTGAENR